MTIETELVALTIGILFTTIVDMIIASTVSWRRGNSDTKERPLVN